jgi:hypothetical protein
VPNSTGVDNCPRLNGSFMGVIMKNYALILLAAISLVTVGCMTHTSSYTTGKDFPSENVVKIVKNETTANTLIQMFGEPFTKTVISGTEEKWLYSYTSGTASAKAGFMSVGNVQAIENRKSLDVLLKNGVVTNYTYTAANEPGFTMK